MGGYHHSGGDEEERQDVHKHIKEAVMDFASDEMMPYQQPPDIDAHIGENHGTDAVGVDETHHQ